MVLFKTAIFNKRGIVKENPARKYKWFGSEDKLRKRHGELLGRAFKGEVLTGEELEEFEILADIVSSDH